MSLAEQFLESIHSSWMAQAICVTAELRLADLLAAGPLSSDELAAATKTHAPSLYRLLRALTTIDICRQHDDGRFEITPTGALLQTDTPGSLRHWTIWWGKFLWPVWGNLLYSVQTGKSARTLLTGTEGFAHLEHDPQSADIFNRAMAELTALTAQNAVPRYDFSSFQRIVDVGGGHGQLLAAILEANPKANGVLFDLPHAMEGARHHLAEKGVLDRCELVSGDFFQSIPAEGDAYVLKSVLHDWNDERAGQILRNCHAAMSKTARLLLVERIVPAKLEPSVEHQSLARTDLSMLVALAAQERSEAQFADLLKSAGFKIARIVPAGMTVSIVEAIPQ